MAKRDFLKRHLLIITLLKRKAATFNEIQQYLIDNEDESGYELEISQRTFQRDKQEIYSVWGVEIVYDRSTKLYRISTEYNSGDEIIERTLESFDLITALKQNRQVGKYIFLEKRKSFGSEFFNAIINAIDNEVIITFDHLSFTKAPQIRKCIPKAIKETQNRFYLIGYDIEKKDFRNYGLDRISNLKVTSEKGHSLAIDIEEFYKDAFGIERTNEAQKIILRFDINQIEYVKSLPFHHSQMITSQNAENFTLELFMHPTHDFLLEIMKYGPICEVLEPKMLRDEIVLRVKKLVTLYQV